MHKIIPQVAILQNNQNSNPLANQNLGGDFHTTDQKDGYSLVLACEIDTEDLAKVLISYGVDVNKLATSDSGTALHMAAQRGNMTLINLLLAEGARLLELHWRSGTVLMSACKQDDLSM